MAVHASHAALPFPVKGARLSLYIPYVDADGDPTAPTTPDTEISKDAAAATDCTEEASAVSGMDGMALLTLTGDEMNCSAVALNAKVASGPKATLATLYPRVLPPLKDHPSGTAQAGAAGTITLQSTAPTFDLAGCIVKTTGGTGGGGGSGSQGNQARVITAYNGASKVATVEPNWETTPDNTTTYAILLTDMFNPSGAADAVVDEVLSSTVHNTDGSLGQRMRRASAVATDGVVNDAAATTTSFVIGGSVTVDDYYNDQVLVFTTGALAGQSKPVLDYVGATKTIVLAEALTSAPANGDEFMLVPVHVHPVSQIQSGLATAADLATVEGKVDVIDDFLDTEVAALIAAAIIRSNTAQAGASGSITLDASASATTDFYVGCAVLLTGGTGAGQARIVTAYNGTTKVATISPAWATSPDNTSTFSLLPALAMVGLLGTSVAEANRLAEISRRRTQANVEASAYGDAVALSSEYGAIQQNQKSDSTTHAGKQTVFQTDGLTELGQLDLATEPASSADVITGIG